MVKKLKEAFSIFTKKTLSEKKIKDSIKDLNLQLITNDVAVYTADVICNKIIESFKGEQISRLTSKKKIFYNFLEEIIIEILTPEKEINLIEEIKEKNQQGLPYIIVFLGVNGTGKTTTIAKIAKYFKVQGFTSVAAASDTFRAGAIEQLSKHMDNVGIRVIKHNYNSDPASVAYDAIEHAKAKHINIVLVDTAGRQVSDQNLMREMQKIIRVAEPDLIVFVGDSLAGNDALEQAKQFKKHVGIDANILTKFDADAKGGAALSISYETNKPIIFVGVGQGYEDIIPFNKMDFISKILDLS